MSEQHFAVPSMTQRPASRPEVVVIKLGALGDIVRTTYLVAAYARARHAKVTWITRRDGVDLLRLNQDVHRLLTLEDSEMPTSADIVLSLDDEPEAVSVATAIETQERVGAFMDSSGAIVYTDSASPWFDMGLISRHGKIRADELKRLNRRSHVELFSEILGLDDVQPVFYSDPALDTTWKASRAGVAKVIGFNLCAGRRWPSKELPETEALRLLESIRKTMQAEETTFKLVAFSDHSNIDRFAIYRSSVPELELWDTGASTLSFAAAVAACDYVVSTDSLGLHLAIAQKVANLSFYAPTSAAEIDTFGFGVKVVSTSSDYCSYRQHADNRTLTAERIFDAWKIHAEEIELIGRG